MSNILPKKSWHVYNEENRLKVKKDESASKLEREKVENRSKAVEREHRLSILRNKSNSNLKDLSSKIEENNFISTAEVSSTIHERFELFKPEDEDESKEINNIDSTKGKFSKDYEMNFKKIREKCTIENEHWREDPIHKYKKEKEKNENKMMKTNKVLKHKNDSIVSKQSTNEQLLLINKQRMLNERLKREAKEREREDELLFKMRMSRRE